MSKVANKDIIKNREDLDEIKKILDRNPLLKGIFERFFTGRGTGSMYEAELALQVAIYLSNEPIKPDKYKSLLKSYKSTIFNHG